MCCGPAAHRTDLLLVSERALTAVDLCTPCLEDLREQTWIEVRECEPIHIEADTDD